MEQGLPKEERALTPVFVFGTLKAGFPNAGSNPGLRLEGDFVTGEAYPLYLVGDRHSPWLVAQPGHGLPVSGEVYLVTAEQLARLDSLERVDQPDGYRRQRVRLRRVERPDEWFEADAYLKPLEQLLGADIREGPLAEYLPEHALLYRRRGS